MEPREPKFTYIRNEKGFPVACLAYSKDIDAFGNAWFEYAVAVHNPKDKFDREMARRIAGGRLHKNPFSLPLVYDRKDWSLKQCLQHAMRQFADDGYPNRLQKAARQYLAYSFD